MLLGLKDTLTKYSHYVHDINVGKLISIIIEVKMNVELMREILPETAVHHLQKLYNHLDPIHQSPIRLSVKLAIEKLQKEIPPKENWKEECKFCSCHEQGDTLYESADWDGGIGFDYIRDIKYCPICGRKLQDE